MTFEIGVNGAVLAAKRHGISRYTAQLLRHLDEIDTGPFEFTVFMGGEREGYNQLTEVPIETSGTIQRMLWDMLNFPRRARAGGVDAIHSPDKGPFIDRDISMVATVHDLLPFLYPDERSLPNRKYWQLSLKRQIELSEVVITVSQSTKNDVVEMFDVDSDRVHVTPLGTDFSPPSDDEVSRVAQDHDIPTEGFRVLYVGNYNDRKNIGRIVDACRQASGTIDDLQLLLAGSNPPEERLRERAGTFREDMKFLGYVPDEQLQSLYGLADLFVYPSIYEGFGLPVLEAMACGTPVITSNTSSLPEVVGDAGITVDPEDTTELFHAIERVHSNDQLRADMESGGLQRAEKMTWEDTAESTLNIYMDVFRNDSGDKISSVDRSKI